MDAQAIELQINGGNEVTVHSNEIEQPKTLQEHTENEPLQGISTTKTRTYHRTQDISTDIDYNENPVFKMKHPRIMMASFVLFCALLLAVCVIEYGEFIERFSEKSSLVFWVIIIGGFLLLVAVTYQFDFSIITVIKKRHLYLPLLFHILDTASDFQTTYIYFGAYRNLECSTDDGTNCTALQNQYFQIFLTSILIIIGYRIMSALIVWNVTRSTKLALMQFLDFYLYKILIRSWELNKMEASSMQDYIALLEAYFESFPQIILNLSFVYVSGERGIDNYFGFVFVICSGLLSMISLAHKTIKEDKHYFKTGVGIKEICNKTSKKCCCRSCVNSRYLNHVLYRFIDIFLRAWGLMALWMVASVKPYDIGPEKVTFDEASAWCDTKGYDLISVHPPIYDIIEGCSDGCWIGLSSDQNATWNWQDGSDIDYIPDNYPLPTTSNTCVYVEEWTDRPWYYGSCTDAYYPLCLAEDDTNIGGGSGYAVVAIVLFDGIMAVLMASCISKTFNLELISCVAVTPLFPIKSSKCLRSLVMFWRTFENMAFTFFGATAAIGAMNAATAQGSIILMGLLFFVMFVYHIVMNIYYANRCCNCCGNVMKDYGTSLRTFETVECNNDLQDLLDFGYALKPSHINKGDFSVIPDVARVYETVMANVDDAVREEFIRAWKNIHNSSYSSLGSCLLHQICRNPSLSDADKTLDLVINSLDYDVDIECDARIHFGDISVFCEGVTPVLICAVYQKTDTLMRLLIEKYNSKTNIELILYYVQMANESSEDMIHYLQSIEHNENEIDKRQLELEEKILFAGKKCCCQC